MAAPGRNCTASSPNCPSDSSGNSAACMPRTRLPSAISPSSFQFQDQQSFAHSIGVIPLSVRSRPYRDGSRHEPTPQTLNCPSYASRLTIRTLAIVSRVDRGRGSIRFAKLMPCARPCPRTPSMAETHNSEFSILQGKLNLASAKFSIGCGDLFDRIADSSRRIRKSQSTGTR